MRGAQSRGVSGNAFAFEGSEEIRTGADGRYRTPAQLPSGHAYRIEAEAAEYEPKESAWIVGPDVGVPDLKLRRSIVVREVAGRVVDSAGRPVAGAEVFQSGDGPRRTHGTTDVTAGIRVSGIPEAPAFLFVAKEGYHFLGRRVEPGETSVAFALRRLDEPPAAPLRPAASPIPRAEERAIARALLAEARKGLGDDRELQEYALFFEASALVDPDLMLDRIENQAVKAEPRLLAALAIARSEDDPNRAFEILDAIPKPDEATYVGLALFDRLGAIGAGRVPPSS